VSGSDFRDLEVWRKARELALGVYKLTADGPLARDFGLRDQMRRAGVSICSNIAEGNERNSDRDTVRFLFMAKGSASELMSQADIASGVGYLGSDEAKKLIGACEEVSRMLGGLIKYREQSI
jgi:four helix bundle protein